MKCKDCKAMCCSEMFTTDIFNEKDEGRINKIADYLGISEEQLRDQYMENASVISKRMVEKEKRKYCIFLDPETFRCTIYEVRPKCCSDFLCGYYQGRGF